jgi:hypothetical protein
MCSSPHTILHVQSDNNEAGGGLFEHHNYYPTSLDYYTFIFRSYFILHTMEVSLKYNTTLLINIGYISSLISIQYHIFLALALRFFYVTTDSISWKSFIWRA